MAQQKMYYKIPKKFIEDLGLANQLILFPDKKTYLCTGVVMARIHPDIEEALKITGGIALTLIEARDEQMGRVTHPLPGDVKEESKPLYGDDSEESAEQTEQTERTEQSDQSENPTDDTAHSEIASSPADDTEEQNATEGGAE